MLEQSGADALYEAGLRVQTTLDADLQMVANTAIDRGLRAVDNGAAGIVAPRGTW